MLHELEQSAEMRALMRTQQVVVAHSRMEAFNRGSAIRREGQLGIPADLASASLSRLLDKWHGKPGIPWTVLEGKKVLDLASGSSLSRDSHRVYHPHFARLAAFNGAAVMAIDLVAQYGVDQHLFQSTQADLVDVVLGDGLPNLEALQGRNFDIIHSNSFVGYTPPESLGSQLHDRGVSPPTFEDLLLRQAGELLSEGGAMCLDTRDASGKAIVYTKIEGKLTAL